MAKWLVSMATNKMLPHSSGTLHILLDEKQISVLMCLGQVQPLLIFREVGQVFPLAKGAFPDEINAAQNKAAPLLQDLGEITSLISVISS